MSTSPGLAARSTADATSRAGPALSGTLTTLRVTQQAVQSVPIAREIIGAAAQIVEFADRLDKNNEKLRTLADRAAALARDVDEVVTTRGGVEGAIARRLEVLTKAFKNVETFMSQEINTAKSLRRLLRRLFVHPTTVDLLFRDLETAVQSFLLTAALDSRLYIEETAPHDGQLLDCHLKKLDAITTRQTEQGTIVYAKARVDGVQELMVVKIHANRTGEDDGADVLASISNLTTSHPNLVQLYARSAKTAATRFTVLRSGVHSAAEYLTCGYADEFYLVMLVELIMVYLQSASAHLEELGLTWLPESLDALVVDDYGQPTVGAFDDITSIDSLPQRKRVLALLSTFSAGRDKNPRGATEERMMAKYTLPLSASTSATRSGAADAKSPMAYNTVVQKDFLVDLSDELATSVQLILEDVPLEGGDGSTQYGLFSGVVALPLPE
ncbi:hypothetical protein EXIGLDRAFT_815690 [Exidia glandulosa HHB12029]|uniref:Protein kinase domain-containing protein n=1 Tax=Exidia glandulosa HHB12029 TaxID=1314781 RepID=A0A165KQA1_EXIGL|nr:hypothetical protein EXIGLDRAFT_815690 [Exidia glandulosa HHB12029]